MNHRAEPYPIPHGWTWSAIGEISVVSGGLTKNLSKRSNSTRQVPLVSVAAVQHQFIDASSIGTIGLLREDGSKGVLRLGDVLIVEGNGSLSHIGRVAIWNIDIEDARHQNHIICIRPTATSPRFTAGWLASPAGREAIIDSATSATGLYTLSISKVETLPIPVPPQAEQRRIIAKLDTLTAKSRRAKEALDAIPALLERFRQSVLAAAFRGDLTADWREKNPDVEPAEELLKRIRAERRRRWEEAELAKMRAKGKVPGDDRWKERYEEPAPVDVSELPELPEGWCWAPAAGVVAGDADIMYGIIQPGPVIADGVPYVRGMDIEDGKILECQLLRTHPDIAARYARASLEGGDILLGIIRATKVAIVPPSLRGANITQGTARLRPAPGIVTEYLAGWLESPWAQDWLHSKYRGIDMPGLNLRDVRLLPVPLAPAEEQRAIVDIIKNQNLRQDRLRPLARSLLQSVIGIDAAILAKAFRGELVPQDPNDEPASALLERIRAEATPNGEPTNGARRPRKRAPPESSKPSTTGRGRKPATSSR
ncbi:restriction endonuclease subunit S [Sorangium sp. So ce1182]|uniref:restriction endonuclease subunit S n=1 Tax=Sorangium sp. So ce1182 TaxID=3133334 RepID=UPI003F630BC4